MAFDVWLAFFVTSWVISLSPGAGAIASMASGLQYGFTRGYWNVIGLQIAIIMQILIVAAGVGTLMTTSTLAFNVIKWFGVFYLMYLAVKQWQQSPSEIKPLAITLQKQVSIRSLVTKGFLVNSTNPKAIVFMLAVLPQFINPTKALVPQYSVMLLTTIIIDMIVMAGYTCLAAHVLSYLKSPQQQRFLNRIFASFFLVAAAILSFVNQS